MNLKLDYDSSLNIDVYFSEKKYMSYGSDQEKFWIILEYTTWNNKILLPPKFDGAILEKLWIMDEKKGLKIRFEKLNFDIFDFEYLKKIQKIILDLTAYTNMSFVYVNRDLSYNIINKLPVDS